MSVSRKPSDEETIVQRIVEAVASATGTPAIELSPPLYDVVDPEALRSLTGAHTGDDLEITFRYNGCRVAVDGAGGVEASALERIADDEHAPGEDPVADGAVARND